jgi:DNA-binding MarR family transcriptional regulator
MRAKPEQIIQNILAHMRDHVQLMSGSQPADGFIIAGLVHILGNQYDSISQCEDKDEELSGPRMGLLIRLIEEEQHHHPEGVTPTVLSQGQHVSRNTISALLKGLEEQGLIERRLDPKDHRLFRIKITSTGKELVNRRAPARIQHMNEMVAVLTPEERTQLIRLMSKLFISLLAVHQGCPPEPVESDLAEEQAVPEIVKGGILA